MKNMNDQHWVVYKVSTKTHAYSCHVGIPAATTTTTTSNTIYCYYLTITDISGNIVYKIKNQKQNLYLLCVKIIIIFNK
jgi:hemolysin activation/secretion protein